MEITRELIGNLDEVTVKDILYRLYGDYNTNDTLMYTRFIESNFLKTFEVVKSKLKEVTATVDFNEFLIKHALDLIIKYNSDNDDLKYRVTIEDCYLVYEDEEHYSNVHGNGNDINSAIQNFADIISNGILYNKQNYQRIQCPKFETYLLP